MVAVHVLDTTESLGAVELLGQAKRVDHMAIVAQVIEQLGIARIVDEHVPPHVDREVSVGACIEALILAILAGGHALVRVGELLQPWDLGLLLGYDELDAAAFNDNRLGRALDTVFNAGISSITTGVVLQAIKAYRLETKLLHFDTTSFSVHGVYLDSSPGDAEDPDGAPYVTRGYSRDHRPDLKQVMFGLTVTNDGYVPILGRVTDGNRSDVLENRFNLTRLAEVLPDPRTVTLIADCKLFSGENLQLAKDQGLNLVTLMPKNIKAWSSAFEAARGELDSAPVIRELTEITKTEDEEGGAVTVTETREEEWRGRSVRVVHGWEEVLEGGGKCCREIELRALVVKSSQLAAAKRKGLKRRLEQEKRALAGLDKRFAKEAQHFDCEADARRHAERAITKHQRFHESRYRIIEEQRRRRGRPKKGQQPSYRRVYKVQWEHEERAGRLEEEVERASCFILVTLPSSEASDADLLELYKSQVGIESNFRWTKVAAEVAPIFLKSPRRIAALGMVYVFALMVYTLIQRQIRASLAATEATIPGNRGRTAKPTAAVLFRLFEGITSQPIRLASGQEFYLLDGVTTEHVAALKLLGCDLLEREHVLARVATPRRGQRGYKPPPDDAGPIKRKRPRKRQRTSKTKLRRRVDEQT